MKKFIVLSLFVALFFNSKAQTSFGLKGGVNLASVKIALAGISLSTTNKTSFVIGGYLIIDLLKVYRFNLNYCYKVWDLSSKVKH